MNTKALEYWIIMYHKLWDPVQLKVPKPMFEVANRQERATIKIEKGDYLIIGKKTFQHLNKCFLIAEVEKI